MKALKAICVVLCFIFFSGIWITAMAYGGLIKDLKFAYILVILFFLLTVIFYLAYQIIKDHEKNAQGRQTNGRMKK